MTSHNYDKFHLTQNSFEQVSNKVAEKSPN